MQRPLAPILLATALALTACGGDDTAPVAAAAPAAVDDASSTLPPDTGTGATEPDAASAATTEPNGSVASATPAGGTIETVESACFPGVWLLDGAGLQLGEAMAMLGDVATEASGGFETDFADGTYTITAQDFVLGVLMDTGSTIRIVVTGTATGDYLVGQDAVQIIETSFDLTADVLIDDAPVDGAIIESSFQEIFGSGERAYSCNDDGTLSLTYPSAIGELVTIQQPA